MPFKRILTKTRNTMTGFVTRGVRCGVEGRFLLETNALKSLVG